MLACLRTTKKNALQAHSISKSIVEFPHLISKQFLINGIWKRLSSAATLARNCMSSVFLSLFSLAPSLRVWKIFSSLSLSLQLLSLSFSPSSQSAASSAGGLKAAIDICGMNLDLSLSACKEVQLAAARGLVYSSSARGSVYLAAARGYHACMHSNACMHSQIAVSVGNLRRELYVCYICLLILKHVINHTNTAHSEP